MTITELAALWDWEELTVKYDLTTDDAIEQFLKDLEFRKNSGMSRTIQFVDAGEEFEPEKKKRTGKQNRSLWKWATQYADALNDAGWDMKRALRAEINIPWTKDSFIDLVYRPVQEAMYGIESTREPDTKQMSQVVEVIIREMATRTGVSVTWPSEDSMRMDSYGN